MEDKLVTLAILTYTKAQILKNVLENEGIETYIHNVNQIQPVVSSGVRLRIKESDLPRALKITESSVWLAESIVGEKTPKVEDDNDSRKILIPVDFSNYSIKACEFGFNFAKAYGAEVLLLHVYFTPIYASSLPYGDVFNYQISDEETVKTILQKVHSDLNALADKIKEKIASGEFCRHDSWSASGLQKGKPAGRPAHVPRAVRRAHGRAAGRSGHRAQEQAVRPAGHAAAAVLHAAGAHGLRAGTQEKEGSSRCMNVNITGPRILAEFSFFGLCDVTITRTTSTSNFVKRRVYSHKPILGIKKKPIPSPH